MDFLRKTINAVLSDLQIVDVIKYFFQKIANSQLKRPPLFMQFLAFLTIYFWFLAILIDVNLGRLNLPIKEKFHKKFCGKSPCSCRAKIEAGQIHKLFDYLTTSIICKSERTAFVVFLEKSKVRMPLLNKLMEYRWHLGDPPPSPLFVNVVYWCPLRLCWAVSSAYIIFNFPILIYAFRVPKLIKKILKKMLSKWILSFSNNEKYSYMKCPHKFWSYSITNSGRIDWK